METANRLKMLRMACALTAAGAFAMNPAINHAATLYWDGGTVNIPADGDGASDGGNGTWNTTILNWDAGAVPHVAWDNTSGDTAVFGGTVGTVSIAEDITAAGINFTTAGYLLNLALNQTLTVNNITASGGGQSFIRGTTNNTGNSHFVNNGGNTLTIQTATANDTFSFAQIGGSNHRSITMLGTGGMTFSGPGFVNMRVMSNASTGQININGGGTVLVNNGNSTNSAYNGSFGTGNLSINGGILEGYFTGSYRTTLGTANGQMQIIGGVSGFSGNSSWTVRLNNGTGVVTWGSAAFNPSKLVLQAATAGASSTMDFQNGLNLNGANRTVTNLSSSGSIAQISGIISNSSGTAAGLTKEGPGLLRLTTVNTYNGATAISAGTLALGASASIANSPTITVASGAIFDVSLVTGGWTLGAGQTLAGNGSILGAVTANGTIAPGNSPGTLTFNNALTLNSTATLAFDLNAGDQTIGGGINDLITGVTNLTLDGVLNVTSSPLSAGIWRLIDYTGTFTDNILGLGTINLAADHLAVIDTSNAGQVNLVVQLIPEPASLVLLGLGSVLMLSRGRRS